MRSLKTRALSRGGVAFDECTLWECFDSVFVLSGSEFGAHESMGRTAAVNATMAAALRERRASSIHEVLNCCKSADSTVRALGQRGLPPPQRQPAAIQEPPVCEEEARAASSGLHSNRLQSRLYRFRTYVFLAPQ